MTTLAEQTGYTTPLPDRDGFQIHVYRPRRLTPPLFYETLMIMLGLGSAAPAPHEVEAIQVESSGRTVHLEMILVDGRIAVVDVPLDCGIRGLL